MIGFGHELRHLLVREHGGIANVVECLNLIQVAMIVHIPQVMVIGHGDVELLHQFRSVAASRDSTINMELSGKELIVFSLNLVDNFGSMDILGVALPVDGGEVLSTRVLSIVVVKDSLKLGSLLSGNVGRGSGSNSVHPLGGKLVV